MFLYIFHYTRHTNVTRIFEVIEEKQRADALATKHKYQGLNMNDGFWVGGWNQGTNRLSGNDGGRTKLLACQHYDIRDNRYETIDQLTTRIDHNDCFSMRWINHGVKKRRRSEERQFVKSLEDWLIDYTFHEQIKGRGTKRKEVPQKSVPKRRKKAKKWRAKSVSKQSKQMGRGKKANKKDRIRPHFLRQRLEKDNLPSHGRKNYMAGNTR